MNWLNAVAMTHANRKSRRASNAYRWHLYSLAAQLLRFSSCIAANVFGLGFTRVSTFKLYKMSDDIEQRKEDF